MTKELEALKNIVNEISNYKLHSLGDENWLGIQDVLKDIDTIEKALTPPTEQEVCEALGKFLNKKIYYEESPFTVFSLGLPVTCDNYIIERQDKNTVAFNSDVFDLYPPHLLTLIGRFYEGKVKE